MKSTFGRSFSVFAGILLVALTVLGGSFQMMVQDFLTDTTFDSLEQDAQIIADLAASYIEDDSLSGREFLMNLDIASKVSGSDAVICNSDGKVTICSDSLFGCKHMGLYVNEEYLQKVLSQGSDRATGLIKGLYSEERFLVALPVTAGHGHYHRLLSLGLRQPGADQNLQHLSDHSGVRYPGVRCRGELLRPAGEQAPAGHG